MLPKPTEKTRRAIASAASTARLVFEVGLSVAGKGGCPVVLIFGVLGLFLGRFGPFLVIFRGISGIFGNISVNFWQFSVILG